MTDLEMTKLCAEAMGIEVHPYSNNKIEHYWRIHHANGSTSDYCPLTDDAKAFALIVRFNLTAQSFGLATESSHLWSVYAMGDEDDAIHNCEVSDKNLNRAIVTCVATMQKAKSGASA